MAVLAAVDHRLVVGRTGHVRYRGPAAGRHVVGQPVEGEGAGVGLLNQQVVTDIVNKRRDGDQDERDAQRQSPRPTRRGPMDQCGQSATAEQQQQRNHRVGIAQKDRAAGTHQQEVDEQERQDDPVGRLPSPCRIGNPNGRQQHEHGIDAKPQRYAQPYPPDCRGGRPPEVGKDVADAVLGHSWIEHEERGGECQGDDAEDANQRQPGQQPRPLEALRARPQRLGGGDPREDEGAVVLQARRHAEGDPVDQERPEAARLQHAVGDVHRRDTGEAQRDVERPEMAVADVEESDRERRRPEESREPSIGAPSELEDEQHRETAEQRIEDANAEIARRRIGDQAHETKWRQPGRRDIEVEMRPVGEVRVQDAMQDAHRPTDRDVLVRSIQSWQPEVDPPQPQPGGDDNQSGDRAGGEAGRAVRVSCRRGPAG